MYLLLTSLVDHHEPYVMRCDIAVLPIVSLVCPLRLLVWISGLGREVWGRVHRARVFTVFSILFLSILHHLVQCLATPAIIRRLSLSKSTASPHVSSSFHPLTLALVQPSPAAMELAPNHGRVFTDCAQVPDFHSDSSLHEYGALPGTGYIYYPPPRVGVSVCGE